VTDAHLLFPPHTCADAILFFKRYNPETETIRFLTYLFVRTKDKISSIAGKLNKCLGFAEDTKLQYYEEVQPAIKLLYPEKTFASLVTVTSFVYRKGLLRPTPTADRRLQVFIHTCSTSQREQRIGKLFHYIYLQHLFREHLLPRDAGQSQILA
jgi:hypothetical protein